MIHLRSIKDYSIFRCDWDDDRARGYYNPPLLLSYNDREVVCGLGTSDHHWLYKIQDSTDDIILLSINYRHYYAVLTVYDGKLEPVSDVFMHNDYDLEGIGDLDELSPITIAKRLYEYCDY